MRPIGMKLLPHASRTGRHHYEHQPRFRSTSVEDEGIRAASFFFEVDDDSREESDFQAREG